MGSSSEKEGRSGDVDILGEPLDLVMKEGHSNDDVDEYLDGDQSNGSKYESDYSDENADDEENDGMEGIVHELE